MSVKYYKDINGDIYCKKDHDLFVYHNNEWQFYSFAWPSLLGTRRIEITKEDAFLLCL